MIRFALDTTTLVALQREPRRATALIDAARDSGSTVRVSAAALAEFLGGSAAGARRAAEYVGSLLEIGGVDEQLARRAAFLQQTVADVGGRARPGTIDALVAADAEAVEAPLIIDGDRAAFGALADASGRLSVVELRELA